MARLGFGLTTCIGAAALLACAFVSSGGAATAVEIPKGTHVLLRMVNSVSTRTAQDGDFVYMRTASPISVEGRIVVPPGSYVQGVVSRTKRSGRISGRAELGIRLETLTLPHGQVLTFSPHLSSIDPNGTGQKVERQEDAIRQGTQHGRDAAEIAITAGTGAALGGLVERGWKGAGIGAGVGGAVGLAQVLATRGSEVDLRSGSTIDVVLTRPVTMQ